MTLSHLVPLMALYAQDALSDVFNCWRLFFCSGILDLRVVCWGESNSPPIVTHSCWRLVRGIAMLCQHSCGILPSSIYVSMLQVHPSICWSFVASGVKSEAETPSAGLEWCVEVEAMPPIVTHSCWNLGWGMAMVRKHWNDILSTLTHVIMLQVHPSICLIFSSSQTWCHSLQAWNGALGWIQGHPLWLWMTIVEPYLVYGSNMPIPLWYLVTIKCWHCAPEVSIILLSFSSLTKPNMRPLLSAWICVLRWKQGHPLLPTAVGDMVGVPMAM